MTQLLADVLGVWLVVTAACSALLGTVVAGQAAVGRARRTGPARRRTGAGRRSSGPDRGPGPRG